MIPHCPDTLRKYLQQAIVEAIAPQLLVAPRRQLTMLGRSRNTYKQRKVKFCFFRSLKKASRRSQGKANRRQNTSKKYRKVVAVAAFSPITLSLPLTSLSCHKCRLPLGKESANSDACIFFSRNISTYHSELLLSAQKM